MDLMIILVVLDNQKDQTLWHMRFEKSYSLLLFTLIQCKKKEIIMMMMMMMMMIVI